MEEQPLPDLFRYTEAKAENRDHIRRLLFHDPDGYMAKLVMVDDPDEERLLAGYQSLTVLARLIWERPYDPKLAARLHRIRCPTLLLWAAHDQLVPPAYAEAYKKYLPQAELRLIPDCGHLAMFEKEKEFVEEVARFCR